MHVHIKTNALYTLLVYPVACNTHGPLDELQNGHIEIQIADVHRGPTFVF